MTTVDGLGATVTVPQDWSSEVTVENGDWTTALYGPSGIVVLFRSPAEFSFTRDRAIVQAAGYYKEVAYQQWTDRGWKITQWEYHARRSDSQQLMHVDVWYFDRPESKILVRATFPTSDGRNDSRELSQVLDIVNSLSF